MTIQQYDGLTDEIIEFQAAYDTLMAVCDKSRLFAGGPEYQNQLQAVAAWLQFRWYELDAQALEAVIE